MSSKASLKKKSNVSATAYRNYERNEEGKYPTEHSAKNINILSIFCI